MLKDVDEDRVGFGDIKADVWNVVGYEFVHHWQNGLFDDL